MPTSSAARECPPCLRTTDVIPLQHVIVTPETPEVIASYWEFMTESCPDSFNAWFAMVPASRGADD